MHEIYPEIVTRKVFNYQMITIHVNYYSQNLPIITGFFTAAAKGSPKSFPKKLSYGFLYKYKFAQLYSGEVSIFLFSGVDVHQKIYA